MFDEIKNMAMGQLQNADPSQLAAAAEEHLSGMPHNEIVDHVQTAVSNLQQSDPEMAGKLQGLVQQVSQNPSDFKGAVVGFIQSNPQVLQHFEPGFAQGLISKVTGGG